MNTEEMLLQIIDVQDQRLSALEDEVAGLRQLAATVKALHRQVSALGHETQINIDNIEHLLQKDASRGNLGSAFRIMQQRGDG